jgi:hypothetical protein
VLARVFACLQTAIVKTQPQLPVDYEIYTIDNSIAAQVEAEVKKLATESFLREGGVRYHYIKTAKNIGYGAANNIAIQHCDSLYHLVMNPDVFVAEDTLLEAIRYMQSHPAVGLLSPDVYGEDGARHYLCKRIPTLLDMFLRSAAPAVLRKLFQKRMQAFEMRDKDYNGEIIDVPSPTGCFMFFHTDVLKRLNGFDERFFLYFEDFDLGRRLLDISHSAYVPQVRIIHQWARASRKSLKMLCIFIGSAFKYWRKYGGII